MAIGTDPVDTPKTTIRVVGRRRLVERHPDSRLDPLVHGRPEHQAGHRDADLGGRQVEVEPIERLAREPGREVALLGELIDLGGPHLDQGELGRNEKAVDQDQAGDRQDLEVSHDGGNPILARVVRAGVVYRSANPRPVHPHDCANDDAAPARLPILTESPPD